MKINKILDFTFKGLVIFFIYFILSCLKDLNKKINGMNKGYKKRLNIWTFKK